MVYKNIFYNAFITFTFLNTVLGFSFSLFSPGFPINTGGGNMVVFTGDSPKLVTFKIAVQNKDNTLSAIESYSAPNTMTGDFIRISIPADVEEGINYWFVAVDSSNESNYATLGPLVIRKMFGTSNPTASITADSSSTPYQTGGSSVPTPSETKSSTNSKTTGSITNPVSTYTPKARNNNSEKEDNHSSPISMGVIIGVAVGGFVLITIIGCVIYCCCVRKAVKTFAPIVNNLTKPSNVNNESSIPITSKPITAVSTSDVHISTVSPPVTPAKPQTMPSSPISAPPEFTINNENVYNHPYPPSPHQQQSYPYPYNPSVLPYPSQDFMPIPEHFNDGSQPYPPYLPAAQNNFAYQQQSYPSYVNQSSWSSPEGTLVAGHMYPPVVDHQTTKVEYVQKPDDSIVHSKPNTQEEQKYSKPHEREI